MRHRDGSGHQLVNECLQHDWQSHLDQTNFRYRPHLGGVCTCVGRFSSVPHECSVDCPDVHADTYRHRHAYDYPHAHEDTITNGHTFTYPCPDSVPDPHSDTDCDTHRNKNGDDIPH